MDDGGRHEALGRYPRDVEAGNPVNRGVQVRADVFAQLQHVPRPRGATLIVAADLTHLQRGRRHAGPAPRSTPGRSRRRRPLHPRPRGAARRSPPRRGPPVPRAPGGKSLPWRMVQRLSATPKASTRSASASSSTASGEEKPPAMPKEKGLPAKRPLPTALVVSSAPIRSPRASSASRPPASAAPRPAKITGRRDDSIRAATAATERWEGRGGFSTGPSGLAGIPSGQGFSTRSMGMLSTMGRRSPRP